jgi:multimeric flavodoxin WrbA
MKVLAINGSPHMDKGNTAMILNPFLEGLKDAGAEVELVYTKNLKIAPCNGDMSCWSEHPGKCGRKDGMHDLLPKIKDADVLVWASPVYYSGITGPLKNLMDRQLPLFASGQSGKTKMAVLVSTCSAWEMEMFNPLLAQMKALYGVEGGEASFAGALLRPHAEVMQEMIKAGETRSLDAVFQAARDAGQQIAAEGKISEETLKAVSKPLMPQDAYNKAAMEMIQKMQEAAKKQQPCK